MTTKAKREGPVTSERVVDAALAVIDGEGLEALTMRRLAHDLGVEPVTVYRQLPNKEAILAGVAERLWRELPPVAEMDDWRAQVRAMWLGLHGLMLKHPNAIPIVAKGGTSSTTAGTVAMAGVLRRGGLDPAAAAEVLHILSACVVGFGFAALWGRQIAAARRPDAPPTAPPDAGLVPYLEAMARWDQRQFETALDVILDAYTFPAKE